MYHSATEAVSLFEWTNTAGWHVMVKCSQMRHRSLRSSGSRKRLCRSAAGKPDGHACGKRISAAHCEGCVTAEHTAAGLRLRPGALRRRPVIYGLDLRLDDAHRHRLRRPAVVSPGRELAPK